MFNSFKTEIHAGCQISYKVVTKQKTLLQTVDLLMKNYNIDIIRKLTLTPTYSQNLANTKEIPWG